MEHYKSVQTNFSSVTMLDGGSLASHSSPHVGRYSSLVSLVKDFITDVSVGHMLKGLPLVHVLHRQGFSSSVCQAGNGQGNLSIYNKSLTAVLEGMSGLVCSRGCTQQWHFCP